MKRLSVNLITLFTLFISSGVYCIDEVPANTTATETTTANETTIDIKVNTTERTATKRTCQGLEGICTEDKDCCEGICKKSSRWNEGFCYLESEQPLVFGLNHAICSYHTLNNTVLRDEEYNKYGLNAAHAVLGAGNNMRVVYRGKEVPVKINELISKSNDTLELSEEAAKELGIELEGIYPCDVEVVIYRSSVDYLYHLVVGFFPVAFICYALYNWLY